jgi:EAL domain-containing protein (putative c-di-GMP-specific phosphodiesterase class I)
MYQAKEKGRGTVERFDLALDQRLSDIVEMKNKLAIAVERGDFELHYQPEVAVKDGKIGAFEALIRWNSPDLGLVPPSRFIPLAEESGLIVPIGEWVLRTACNQLVEWRSRGIDVPVVAINLSARQLALPDLVDIVRAILVETGAEPAWIQIEVTETSAMKDPEAARRTLTSLKELGVSIALDDFGTGYSALAYLRRFPFDRLKLDRTFLRDLAQSADNQALVRGIIALAGSLNLEVVAEGVETVAQFELLCRYGCDYLQGYGLCRPVPAADAEALLRNGSRLFERMMPAGAPPPPDNVHELRRRV